MVMRRLHRGRLTVFEFGSRKLEQLVNLVIAGGMLAGAMWILADTYQLITGADAVGSPAGFAVAGIVAGLNFYTNAIALDGVRRAAQGGGSLIMQGQLQARRVKVVSSAFVQLTLTIAALSTDATVIVCADAIGALFVCGFIVHAAFVMIRTGLPDLIDQAVTEELQAAINRVLAKHFDDYHRLDHVRTRRSGETVYAEVALGFESTLTMGEVHARIDSMKASLREELGEAECRSSRLRADAFLCGIVAGGLIEKRRLMTITEETHDRTHVLLLAGRLDSATSETLAARIEALVADGKPQLLIDCSGSPVRQQRGPAGAAHRRKKDEGGGRIAVLLCAAADGAASLRAVWIWLLPARLRRPRRRARGAALGRATDGGFVHSRDPQGGRLAGPERPVHAVVRRPLPLAHRSRQQPADGRLRRHPSSAWTPPGRRRSTSRSQVQEWKNLLLRGQDAADYERYLGLFHTESAQVVDQLNRAAARKKAIGMDAADVEAALAAHAVLRQQYADAIRGYQRGTVASVFAVDAAIRGRDRPLNTMIDAIADTMTNEVDGRTRAFAEADRRRYQILRAVFVTLSVATLILAGWLVVLTLRRGGDATPV